jgi:hypothetical protein
VGPLGAMTQKWKEHAFVDKNEIDHSSQIRNVGCSHLGGASSSGRQFLLDQSTEVQDEGHSKLPSRLPSVECRRRHFVMCGIISLTKMHRSMSTTVAHLEGVILCKRNIDIKEGRNGRSTSRK